MPALDKNKLATYLVLFAICLIIGLGLRLVLKVQDVGNSPNSLTKKEELSQLPVDIEQSNTIAIVCPLEAKNNSSYPDTSCRNTQYFGPAGIREAILQGGAEHTVYIKNGSYNVGFGLTVPRQKYLRIEGESRDSVVLYRNNVSEDSFVSPLLLLQGDGGLVIENITFISPSVFLDDPTANIVGIAIGANTAATIKNNAFYNLHQGVFLDKDTQDIKVYQNVFYNNFYGLTSITNNLVYFENNIVFGSKEAGVVFEYPHNDQPTSTFRSQSLPPASNFNYKTVKNNVFYNNKNGVYMINPGYLKMVNNILTKTEQYGLVISALLQDNSGSLEIDYNYTSQGPENWCGAVDPTDLSYSSCLNLISPGPNFANYSENVYALISPETGEYNFRLSQSSGLINEGNPIYADKDGTRSDPGAYGGTCSYDFDGCGGLEFPNLLNIPEIAPGDGVVYDPNQLDLNKDGKVDIIDVIEMIKYVFK